MKVEYVKWVSTQTGLTEGLLFQPDTLGEKEVLQFFEKQMRELQRDPDGNV